MCASQTSPPFLTVLRALAVLESVALAGLAAFLAVEVVVADSDNRTRALVAAGLAVLAAVALALVTRGLVRCRRWARAPLVVTNLLVLPVAVDLVRGDRWYVGGPLLVLAVAVLGLLFAPATEASLDE